MHNQRMGMGFSFFALGAAIGACMAALYTPHTGRRLRRIVRRHAEDAQARAVDTGRHLADRGRDLYERGTKYAMMSR